MKQENSTDGVRVDHAPCAGTLAGCAPECGPENRCRAPGVTPSDGGQRARFETAMRVKHPEWAFTADPVFDYHNERTRCAWEGWQAALASGVMASDGSQPE